MLATSSSINPRPPPTPQNPSSTTQNPSNHSTHQPAAASTPPSPYPSPQHVLHTIFSAPCQHKKQPLLAASFRCTQFGSPTISSEFSREPVTFEAIFQPSPATIGLPNRYFLVRAWESQYESIGVINKNPVAKTSIDNGLSEKGKKQAVRSAFDLNEMGACDKNCWIWPSITQRAYPAAEIIAAVNGVSRSYIVPEYNFLDARGLGAHEGKNLEAVSEVYASDTLSPNESVSDVFVRVIQLISILKT